MRRALFFNEFTHSNSASSSTGSSWRFNGNTGANTPWAQIELGGEYGQNSDGSSGNYNTGSVTVNVDFWGRKYYCPKQNFDDCSPYDPCLEALKEYRGLI